MSSQSREEEARRGRGKWLMVCGSAFSSWGTGWWLVVLGSVIVPQPPPPHYFCILLQTQKGCIQKGVVWSEDPDSVKVSEPLWSMQGSC